MSARWDFTAAGWGQHAHPFPSGQETRWTGHGPRRGYIAAGDTLITDAGAWRVVEVRYMRDPPDQWFATLERA